jgi:hypothetical protein
MEGGISTGFLKFKRDFNRELDIQQGFKRVLEDPRAGPHPSTWNIVPACPLSFMKVFSNVAMVESASASTCRVKEVLAGCASRLCAPFWRCPRRCWADTKLKI